MWIRTEVGLNTLCLQLIAITRKVDSQKVSNCQELGFGTVELELIIFLFLFYSYYLIILQELIEAGSIYISWTGITVTQLC